MTTPRAEEEELFLPDPEPEPIAAKLRAVCGFLVGLGIAGVTWLKLHGLGQAGTMLLFTVMPVGFAYCAARWGDAFWAWLKDGVL